MYDTVIDRLVTDAEPLIPVPQGFVIGQSNNNQLVPKTHENKAFIVKIQQLSMQTVILLSIKTMIISSKSNLTQDMQSTALSLNRK